MQAVFKAVADLCRLRILRVLLEGRFNVNELCDILELGQSRVSRHLGLLLGAGLVLVEREATWAYYQATGAEAAQPAAGVLALIRQFGADLPGTARDMSRLTRCLERRRQRSHAFHEKVAPCWAELRRELLGDAPVGARIAAHTAGAAVVVDLGCGDGELLCDLAHAAGRVIGVDSSAAMLSRAERRLEELAAAGDPRAGRIELRLGALEHLPLRDGEADRAVLNMVLHHLAAPAEVLREAGRVLSARGRLILSDLRAHQEEWMREKYGDQWLGFNPEQISLLLEEAGFRPVAFETYGDTPNIGTLLSVAKKRPKGVKT